MSSDPQTTPAPAEPLADFVAANRPTLGWALAAVGLAVMIVSVLLLSKAIQPYAAPDAKAAETTKDDPAEKDPEKKDGDGPPHPYRTEYTWGGLIGVAAALAVAGVGVWMALGIPRVGVDGRRSDARTQVLAAGAAVGLSLILGGLVFFVIWFKSLQAWLNDGKTSEAAWVVGPILAVLVGAGLIFLACQPARREERSNPTLRRLVYGTNLALGCFLLFVLLLVGNVLAGLKLPNKLDATATGFYSFSLDARTTEYLAGLTEPIKIYSTIPDELAGAGGLNGLDARRLVEAIRDANPTLITVRQLSTGGLDQAEISRLRAKYTRADMNQFGLLVTVGADESRYGFIRFEELFERSGQKTDFVGESRVLRELLFLSEGGSQPVVYVLQGHGELALTGGAPDRSLGQVRTELEKNNYKVLPLAKGQPADPTKPAVGFKVPDDADVVVIADPTRTVEADVLAAVRDYMAKPRPNGKKGKLLVLAGAHATPAGAMQPVGLDEFLAPYGVKLDDRFLYAEPTVITNEQQPLFEILLAQAPAEAATGKNIVGIMFESYRRVGVLMPNCRAVEPGPAKDFQTARLLTTRDGLATWSEESLPENPARTYVLLREPVRLSQQETNEIAIARHRELRQRLGYSEQPRPIAATASEGDSPRVVVIGSGEFFADEYGRMIYRGQPIPARLFTSVIDYLRDRPAVATVVTKTYGIYTPNPEPNWVRLLWLPGGIAMLVILALGVGMWASRRA